MTNTLLLTSTIIPSTKIANKSENDLNIEIRKRDYIRALLYYITQSNFDNIIFCENSNTNLKDFEEIKKIAKSHNKKLEILVFNWNKDLALNYWYWAWEAEIFDYCFENSKLFKNLDSFYKITWRYILKDINYIIWRLENTKNYFHKQWLFMSQFTVSTAFFRISKENYEKYLYKKQIKLYEELDKKDYKNEIYFKNHFPIERVWYTLLRNEILRHKQPLSFPIIYEYPKTNSHWINENIRNIVYKSYCYLKLNQYWFVHKIIDKLFYKLTYKKLIIDNLINY